MYLSAPLLHPPLTRQLPNISHICQLQLQQLALQIPVLQAQIVHWHQSGTQPAKTRQVTSLHEQSSELLWYSKYQKLLIDSDEFLTQFATLPLQVLTVLENFSSNAIASVCRFGQQGDFLLLWTQARLSSSQQMLVEGQVQLLEHFLTMHQAHLRQQAENQLLEQILQCAEHQLRNPLALISLYAENLYLGLSADGQKQQVALIRETTAQLTESVSNLFACGQQSQLRVVSCDVLEILRDAAAGLQPWLREKQVKICFPKSTVHLSIDRWQVQQVFHNLLHNAVQFSPLGGVITCQWQIFQQEVLITIADQGCGLPEADIEQVFKPFYSRRPGGTGLGLAIAQKIILDHQGSLWAENLSQGGAQFSISLPKSSAY
ncbi:MAG: HAMP domain-containing histidine kinase [Timaviella obliquedivisa GSE-PSE-MK23-08B]|jgi:signal transduction histidine kinase|nr:HAMP domain-containing histidine kinase [Timaviella obliquedivisa GSE-PSE-MK23-08B]